MMYFLKYFEKDFKIYLIFSLITIWALSSTYVAVTKKEKILLFQMNEFGTEVIDGKSRTPVEVENFIHKFTGLFYTYNTINYEDHMNRVVPLIDIDVLRNFEDKINSKFDKLQKVFTSQFAYIEKLTKISDSKYEIKMRVETIKNELNDSLQAVESDYTIRASVARVQRSLENPYGLEIRTLEEIYE